MMRLFRLLKSIAQPGPILTLMLIGILLLSALVYYRAINIQRFLEPALAVSEPRLRFNQNIKMIISQEFGAKELRGIKFRFGSILMEQSLLSNATHPVKGKEPPVLNKLGRVLLKALKDPEIRSNISLILVCVRYPLGPDAKLNKELRFQVQERAALILNSLFIAEPELEKEYGFSFAATALPVTGPRTDVAVLEFRLIPAERLHIDILQKLEKYSY